MKTLNDLRDELSIQFGSIMSGMSSGELDIILTFILTSFAYDFPEVNSRAYVLGDLPMYRLYLDDIHEEFQEVQFTIPMKRLSILAKTFYKNIYEVTNFFTQLDEMYAIQLAYQYIEEMSTYYVPKKPMILTDDTGEYLLIDKDLVIYYLTGRIIDPNNIQEYVYGVLRTYSYYKFVDFIINRQFSNLMDVNQKVFDLIYGSVASDLTTGDLDQVTSVSLSGLSVSFANKLNDYSSSLASLANSFNNPTFIQEMNNTREKFLNKFKRKKSVFYNYLF